MYGHAFFGGEPHAPHLHLNVNENPLPAPIPVRDAEGFVPGVYVAPRGVNSPYARHQDEAEDLSFVDGVASSVARHAGNAYNAFVNLPDVNPLDNPYPWIAAAAPFAPAIYDLARRGYDWSQQQLQEAYVADQGRQRAGVAIRAALRAQALMADRPSGNAPLCQS